MSETETFIKIPDFSKDIPRRDVGETPEISWLPISKLRIDRKYQRTISGRGRRVIREIASKFTWSRFGIICVRRLPNDVYAVTDGQHRSVAALALGLDTVPCLVTESGGLASDAQDFIGINTARTNVTGGAAVRARLVAEDPVILAIVALLEEEGARFVYSKPQDQPWVIGDTMCYMEIETCFNTDKAVLRQVLKVLVAAERTPLRKRDIRTVFDLLRSDLYGAAIKPADLIAALKQMTYGQHKRAAEDHREATGDKVGDCWELVLWRKSQDVKEAMRAVVPPEPARASLIRLETNPETLMPIWLHDVDDLIKRLFNEGHSSLEIAKRFENADAAAVERRFKALQMMERLGK